MSFFDTLSGFVNVAAAEASKQAVVAARVIAAEAPKHIQAAQNFANEASKVIAAEAPGRFEAARSFAAGAAQAAKCAAVEAANINSEECRKILAGGSSTMTQRAVYLAAENPVTAAAVGVGLLTAAVPAILSSPFMLAAGALGFTANGVVAGSIAAAVQATIPNVVGGSTFAILQSAAAGGTGLAVVNGVAQVAGGTVAAVGGLAGVIGQVFGNSTA
ncbi:hypothetical protein PT974_06985 [Cladobotryum mycophilum]|uniref:Uncharacterized protein n=1 Tax=Cladobotryum mycophilum TaxID=491253 RepID=A0ABR0SMY1_9HYPO